jgi:hypothetical protein
MEMQNETRVWRLCALLRRPVLCQRHACEGDEVCPPPQEALLVSEPCLVQLRSQIQCALLIDA